MHPVKAVVEKLLRNSPSLDADVKELITAVFAIFTFPCSGRHSDCKGRSVLQLDALTIQL
jgi:hypothetical protein